MPDPRAEFTLHSEADLFHVADWVISHFPKGAFIGLSGELGAGKTTFVRKLIERIAGEGKAPRVTSPTYVIHQKYNIGRVIHHFDLYRLENISTQTLIDLSFDECLEDIQRDYGFILMEWWERAQTSGITPQVILEFSVLPNEQRKVVVR